MAYKHTLKRTPKSKSKSRSKPGPRGMIMAKDGLVSHDKLPRTLQKRYGTSLFFFFEILLTYQDMTTTPCSPSSERLLRSESASTKKFSAIT